jgi:hypothetical protein
MHHGSIAANCQLQEISGLRYHSHKGILLAPVGHHHRSQEFSLRKMLMKEPSLSNIMRRMPAVDWKQCAMDMPNWVKDMVESAFDKFVE